MNFIERVMIFVAFLMLGVAISLSFGGCAQPKTRTVTVDGIEIIEHVDFNDNPCGNRGPTAGCYQFANGTHSIWRSGVSPEYVWRHEVAHAKGMRHTVWSHSIQDNSWCSTVTASGGSYKVGQKICITTQGESIT